MNRTQLNFALDSLITMVFLGLIFTGLILTFGIPHGIGRDATLWSLSRHDWGDLHFWLAMTFITAIAVHLVLHWTWIRSTATSKLVDRRVVVSLLAAMGLMVVGFVAALWSAPTGEIRPEGEYRYERRGAEMGEGGGWRRGQ